MKTNLGDLGKWVSMEEWRSAFPYLEEANLRLVHRHLSKAALRLVLYAKSEYLSDELRGKLFTSPTLPGEKTIMVLADLVIALRFPQKIIPGIIHKAIVEVEEAYKVILQKGGGWASRSQDNPEKRKTAVLQWFRKNQARLSYLKEPYLEDLNLYVPRSGQEKRDFRAQLLVKIIEETTKQELPPTKITEYYRDFKKSK